jgi:hypothetical protein
MKTRELICSTAMLFVVLPVSAYSADLAGTVTNGLGQPVAGVQIQLQDGSGKAVAQQLTDSTGHYGFTELTPGTYECVLNPSGSQLKGGSAEAKVETEGTTLNWKVEDSAAAMAGVSASDGSSSVGTAVGPVSASGTTGGGSPSAADPLFVHSGPIGNPVGGPPNHGLGSSSQ